ncbi:MSHA biogenesis protein MshP [Idiomarina loihiensis]|jgi:MSHA biogenesis protein MshP|uniref:type IV pilus modification PilV family protein n=1 Tax=Idiomarina TaxID=135575 RepID=UPI000C47693B|nr:Type II secretory pathway component [Idiomarina]MAA62265.1 Type II secretory pathway component [Idiomarina sp.]PWW37525.1 MSHA biogenesis protein MshP [Idiomarina loihiensis]TDP47568.1 MSHA biogenesis protein MshP [Idiomarina loihiensis]TDS23309.1 MSHA biogenesis protein MshP [Idiomarina sp. H2]|tara:strand:+ start:2746 stop:3246 length:501 start_codon:yes stop_codon:yes gene_type:complete
MRHNSSLKSVNKQRGSTLVIAVFVIVVLGGLVAALASLLRTSSESVVIEVLGTRSYLAAQSGLEQAMMTVYSLGDEPETNCSVIATPEDEPFSYESPGLQQCHVNISCGCAILSFDGETTTSSDCDEEPVELGVSFTHLVITSKAVCEAGAQRASRQLQIETRVKN